MRKMSGGGRGREDRAGQGEAGKGKHDWRMGVGPSSDAERRREAGLPRDMRGPVRVVEASEDEAAEENSAEDNENSDGESSSSNFELPFYAAQVHSTV